MFFVESIHLYAKHWSKRERVDFVYLSEWKDHLKELVGRGISRLKGHFKSPKCKVLSQPDVKDTLHKLHINQFSPCRQSCQQCDSCVQEVLHQHPSGGVWNKQPKQQ